LNTEMKRIKVSPSCALKVTTMQVEDVQGIVVRLYLLDEKGKQISHNFHFPAMEPNRSTSTRIKDTINARFDGWWRKYMIKLMEMQKLREDYRSWQAMKQ